MDNRPGQAVEFLRHALRGSPGNPGIETALAEALLKDNQPEEGQKEARDAIARHPEFGPAYDLVYSQYILAKRWDDAELAKAAHFKQSQGCFPVIRLAGFYAGRQKPEEAEKTIDSLVARRDMFPEADLLAGDFHSLTRSFDKALADYQRGLSRDKPRENTYQLRSAAVLAILGRRDEGLKDVNAVLAKDPKDLTGRALKASILLEMGGAQNFKGRGRNRGGFGQGSTRQCAHPVAQRTGRACQCGIRHSHRPFPAGRPARTALHGSAFGSVTYVFASQELSGHAGTSQRGPGPQQPGQ